ncbi:MAG: NADP(H)-dependent aldo-keto reductase [Ectothiorhodospiraceae bacterium]|nr:NADP(H)-dependent aldo-keto reductase [Ectothiorhodospiraceae bacterium]
MEYRKLGRTDVEVSVICLGTMTWGEQNTEAEAHAQLNIALSAGVNFIDTAEMYPVPPKADTYTMTEQIIGRWLKARGKRGDIVLASKVASRSDSMDYIRGGGAVLDRNNIEQALHGSLERLQTDYLDVYQLHWPDRLTNYFGELGYVHRPEPVDPPVTPVEETLQVLADLVKAGKIRYVGLSNETPWGTLEFIRLAEQCGLPRVVSVQNPYSLLNRSFEVGMAEVAHREDCGLLAYSPLGFGVLSGKYINGQRPTDGRITLYERFTRYSSPQAEAATQAYVALAREYHIDPAQMALAFVSSRPFVTSTIIGATTMAQLQSNLASAELVLSEEILTGIEGIQQQFSNPAP